MLPSNFLFILNLDDKGAAFPSLLRAALKGGCRWVMLRGVKTSPPVFLSAATYAKNLCAEYKAALFISREVQLAKRIKAAGIHVASGVPAQRMRVPGALLGQSCHNARELGFAEQAGVDYVSLSPVFLTQSKPGYGPALGLEKLSALIKKTKLPVVALGGIGPENAADCMRAGAAAVAIMGGIAHAKNPEAMTSLYLQNLIPALSRDPA